MTTRRFLHNFVGSKSAPQQAPDDVTSPVIFQRPGMHQPIDEPDPLSFSAEDHEFLRHVGIHTPCDRVGRESLRTQ